MTATVRARWTLRTVAQLLILGAVAFCTLNAPDDAFGSSAPTSQSVARTSPVADGAEARFARTALRLTNQARATHDLPPLRLQPCLAEVAQDWAATLAEQARLTEQDLGPVADACGTSAGTGANVATGYTTPRDALRGWMRSGHRATVLGATFTHIGIGVVQDAEGHWWWVQDLGARA